MYQSECKIAVFFRMLNFTHTHRRGSGRSWCFCVSFDISFAVVCSLTRLLAHLLGFSFAFSICMVSVSAKIRKRQTRYIKNIIILLLTTKKSTKILYIKRKKISLYDFPVASPPFTLSVCCWLLFNALRLDCVTDTHNR